MSSNITNIKMILHYNSNDELIFIDKVYTNPDGSSTIFRRSTAKSDYTGGTTEADIDSSKDWIFDKYEVV